LKDVWNNGKFKGSYRYFRDRIRAGMADSQSPNYYFVGASNPQFEGQKPFTV
jgi:metacaspase-1